MKSWGDYLWHIDAPPVVRKPNSIALDLGSGRFPRNPFGASHVVGTDHVRLPSSFLTDSTAYSFEQCDISDKLSFGDDHFDYVTAFDVLEHVPRWNRSQNGEICFPFVRLMSEIHRILKPNGLFMAITPGYPSEACFTDPTHINYITIDTAHYFTEPSAHATYLGYGFQGTFSLLRNEWLRGSGVFTDRQLSRLSFMDSGTKHFLLSRAKLAKRFMIAIYKRNPTHIIWVFQKT